MKRGEKGKLLPIVFEDSKTLEWVDLSNQTFKIVSFPKLCRPLSARERTRYLESMVEPQENQTQQKEENQQAFQFPILFNGLRMEVYNITTAKYDKAEVVRALPRLHQYEVTLLANKSRLAVDLSNMRCKVQLPDFHGLDLSLLMTHVIEVYIKEEKRVNAGRICGYHDERRMLHVRYQGGRKEWIPLKSTKVKIRLQESSSSSELSTFTHVDRMDSQAPPTVDDKPLQKSHSFSESITRYPPSPHPFRRSSTTNLMLERTPLSPMRQFQECANVISKVQTLRKLVRAESFESMDACTIDSARTVESLSEIDSDPQQEWYMEIDPTTKQTYYVHLPTGTSQWQPPSNVNIHSLQWIATNKIENNPSLYQLPIGPIEAVRLSRLSNNT